MCGFSVSIYIVKLYGIILGTRFMAHILSSRKNQLVFIIGRFIRGGTGHLYNMIKCLDEEI